ncbi:Outer membrane protein transport protein (OMPP1/FadL/TodX) [Psychrobacter pasteurii]|uniref:Outer membrane protein transport protein (OMPP1/FadL/TodX) n=1 Tax=Psychrobacter pasteurii TaxID=1945520 RepID=A0A1R4EC43_9GAMM|nr:outer membrane protein transport protein [Psychrobacter pasteurii]SJM36072.1 Outer membrane protein transport protein (OMPP1/FadL/TodX) [Psychrobacter pasteurii]
MSQKFPISKLTLALLTLPVASLTHAAGIDRSGQDIKGFFNDGTYAEIDFAYLKTDISGHDNAGKLATIDGKDYYANITKTGADYVKGNSTGNISKDAYSFMRYGVKTDLNDMVSVGLFYDEPYGAEVRYEGENAFVSKKGELTLADPGGKRINPVTEEEEIVPPSIVPNEFINENIDKDGYDTGTNVRLHTESWTGLVGFKSPDGFQIYGGPVLQKVEAKVNLRGTAYGPLSGYDANVNHDTAFGWVAGVGYSKPEIALKANLTYRSEIDHKTKVSEYIPLLENELLKGKVLEKLEIDPNSELAKAVSPRANARAKVTTPESVNFNFETGLSAKHQLLGTLDVRWVPWSDFSIVPPLYNAYSKAAVDGGLPLLDYKDDQWKVDIGLAKRFNEKLAGSVVVGWDSGAGDPVSSLGPVEGYYSIGGGVKYNITPEWAISAGGKYLKFGDATGKLPNDSIVSKFQDNDGYVLGAKLSYHSK